MKKPARRPGWWNHVHIYELGRYQLIDGGNDEYCSLLRRLLRGITCGRGYLIVLRASGIVMLMQGPVKSLHCLAANMRFVEKGFWPRIVERFQDTLDLQESEATVSLKDDRLTLAANSGRYVVEILAA
ncbi:hypothetical protein M3484_22270 [Pseudomonas sp. GX19020]|uniref:hypothetical protein n=1 Tax=Pseudomonas sp. GX19020 TaxID=2942277 RepID=UPI0020190A25|nr:hypothetical protein [Pseudomonas sp. GX19020]MCL4069287.1 hypothetical protein [Pseudomonas sp. GX19020]